MVAKKSTAKKASAPQSSQQSGAAKLADYAILRAPVITEKAAAAGSHGASAVFEVDRRANKVDIKQAIERIYGVKVQSINTCNILGKPKRWMTSQGRRASFKKAYVTLKEGHTINLVEGL